MRLRILASERGQSTLEYVFVSLAFVAMVVALGILWRWASGGGLVEWAIEGASHVWRDGGAVGTMGDVLMY